MFTTFNKAKKLGALSLTIAFLRPISPAAAPASGCIYLLKICITLSNKNRISDKNVCINFLFALSLSIMIFSQMDSAYLCGASVLCRPVF